jgi:hypothetical protein
MQFYDKIVSQRPVIHKNSDYQYKKGAKRRVKGLIYKF